jgi:phospholipid transport system substrate-binding protein
MRSRAALVVAALVLAPAIPAAPPPSEAVAAIRTTLDAALGIARAGGTREENLTKLRAVARDILDTRTMGRRALGDVLAKQPAEQQEEYLKLFDEVMVRAYLSKLLLFRDPRFGYGDPRPRGDGLVVPTTIATAKDEYHVDYEMRDREGRWVATDVLVENISLTDNYKSQFAQLLHDRSFAELLDLMRKKVGPAAAS